MRLSILVLMVAAIGLAFTNPTMAGFEAFAEQHAEAFLVKETGGPALGRALAGAGAGIAGSYLDRLAEREDYVLYSIYTVDLSTAPRDTSQWRILGIGGRFVELERPETPVQSSRW